MEFIMGTGGVILSLVCTVDLLPHQEKINQQIKNE